MIQDITPSVYHLDYTLPAPRSTDAVAAIHGQHFLLNAEHTGFPSPAELEGYCSSDHLQYLFAVDDRNYYLADEDTVDALWSEQKDRFVSFRDMRRLRPMALSFAGYTAWHLWSWYRSNRYCGCCGSLMQPGTDERKLVCHSCGSQVYPRINPAVIVAVCDGDRLLMTKYNRPGSWFVLIAGFVEIGESAEDTVHREVMEEAGVKVKNIRYFGSQPWGIPGNLTLGYTCELDGDDTITLDTAELSDARWFHRSDVPVPDDDVSLTSAMIHAFSEGKL